MFDANRSGGLAGTDGGTGQKPAIPTPPAPVPFPIPRPAADESRLNDSESTVRIGSLPRLGSNWGMEGFLLEGDDESERGLETSEVTRSNSNEDMNHRTSESEGGEHSGVVFGRIIVVKQPSDSEISTAHWPFESETDITPSQKEDKEIPHSGEADPASGLNVAFGSSSTFASTTDLWDHDPDATVQASPRWRDSRAESIVVWRDHDFEKLALMLSNWAEEGAAGAQ